MKGDRILNYVSEEKTRFVYLGHARVVLVSCFVVYSLLV